MHTRLRKCKKCGEYTMKDTCSCGNETSVPVPPRFSPQDRFGYYRRRLKTINMMENKDSK